MAVSDSSSKCELNSGKPSGTFLPLISRFQSNFSGNAADGEITNVNFLGKKHFPETHVNSATRCIFLFRCFIGDSEDKQFTEGSLLSLLRVTKIPSILRGTGIKFTSATDSVYLRRRRAYFLPCGKVFKFAAHR